ncbi:helix-turn-helix transcriptional regulator [Archangium lansingense]|uniref:Helix-turn-helix transcriptional regulator n=1 Tax=Archangium lansingense TaxID=2995310 RepID=A0ABT3ZZ16_9BACT|nr:helix-turn-helix transcriptional regulator [Archangium lansinium]MCY1074638.1 helix-turn-helix transcriptional regulator [Archangium lansinium]
MSSLPVPTQRLRQLALWLRATRVKAGLTQHQVAQAAELYTEVYGRIERAGMIPTVPTLQKICLILKLDYQSLVDRVMRGEEPPED